MGEKLMVCEGKRGHKKARSVNSKVRDRRLYFVKSQPLSSWEGEGVSNMEY